jgi:hypothetical protein
VGLAERVDVTLRVLTLHRADGFLPLSRLACRLFVVRGPRPTLSSPLRFHFAENLPKTRRALEFARSRHGDQHRGGDGAVFVVHPAEVASLLARLDYPDDVVAAAVLHDVLEDTDAELADLRSLFGWRVAQLVAVVSDDPALGDEDERKAEVRERVRAFGGDALAVYAADKVSKVRELRLLMVRGLPADEAEAKFGRYQASLAMLEKELGDAHLVELLRFEVEALAQLPPEPAAAERTQAPAGSNHPGPVLVRQRDAVLPLANQVRGQRTGVKRGITEGTISVRALLQAPSKPADGCTVAELLRSQAGWGPARTLRFLTRHGVADHKQLGQLTARQRAVMANDLA